MKHTLLSSLLLLSGTALASLLPMQSDYYYKLGGDSDVYIPPVNRDQVIVIGGNVNTGTGLNCNLFNPVVSISNTFQDLKNSATGIPASVIDNLKGSVAGYPMYKLQQAMPGLYNLLQNTAFSAQNEFALKVQDCQAVKRTLEEGKSPLISVLSVSDSQGWIDAASRVRQGESLDITKTAKNIAKHGDEYGLPWVHQTEGNSSGRLQQPIKVINDVVIAGYNLLLTPSRALDNLSPPNSKANHFVNYWPAPNDAAQWAVMVLGDIQISHQKTSRDVKAGVGLSTLLHSCPKVASSKTCATNVSSYLWQMVDKKILPTEVNLRKLAASNILITDDIILSIQRMPREQQVLTVAKLSEEIAIQNLLDEAMMLRRLLQAGFQIQEVQNLKPAQTMVNNALKKLDGEIQTLAFENDVRKKMMGQTLNLIMELRAYDMAASIPGEDHEQTVVKNGAVYPNQ